MYLRVQIRKRLAGSARAEGWAPWARCEVRPVVAAQDLKVGAMSIDLAREREVFWIGNLKGVFTLDWHRAALEEDPSADS